MKKNPRVEIPQVDRFEGNLSDMPLNKPFGEDIDPELWYVLVHEPEKQMIGIAKVGVINKQTGEQNIAPMCFGNHATAVSCLAESGIPGHVIQGSDMCEMFMAMVMNELEHRGGADA